MKNLFILPLILIIILTSCTINKKEEWILVWVEDFDQTTLDTAVWSKIPRGTSDWNKFMSDYDSCYAFQDGNLVLRGIPNATQSDTAKILTGGVWSKGKKAFQNGRIEFRARLDEAKGFWPAIWMMPEDKKWPEGGEIDIMEHLNYDSIVYQTVHTSFTLADKQGPQRYATYPIQSDDYNTYALDFYPDSLRFFTNNALTFCYFRIDSLGSAQFPFEDDFYILISNQIGGSWVGDYDIEQLPVNMYIDWIRFYQKRD